MKMIEWGEILSSHNINGNCELFIKANFFINIIEDVKGSLMAKKYGKS